VTRSRTPEGGVDAPVDAVADQAAFNADVVRLAPWIVVVLDVDGRVEYVNPHFSELTGWSAEEAHGLDWFETFLPDRERKRIHALDATAAAGTPNEGNVTPIRARDGSEIVVEWYERELRNRDGDRVALLAFGLDVTARRASEDTLLRQARFLDDVSDAIVMADLNGRITDWGGGAERVFGYTAAEMVGNEMRVLFAQEVAWDTLQSKVLDPRVAGEPHDLDVRVRRKSGDELTAFLRLRPVFGGDGRPIGTAGYYTDVTAQRHAAESLRESEEKLSKAFHRNPVGMAVRRVRDDVILDVNPSYEALTGYTRDELVGHAVAEFGFYPRPEDRQAVLRKTDRGEQIQNLERDLRSKNGEIRRVLMSVDPITIRGEPCALASFIDVTEQRRAEQQIVRSERRLRRSEERLREAVHVASLGIYVHDRATDTLYWSPEMRTMCGLTATEAVSVARYLELLHPDDVEAVAEGIKRAHDPTGDGRFDLDYRIIRPDGSMAWLTTKSQTIFEGEGTARAWTRTVGAVQDVTVRSLAEQEILESREQYRVLFEQANVGVAEGESATGRLVRVNSRFAEILGATVEEVEQLTLADIIHPDSLQAATDQRAPLVRGQLGEYTAERRLRRKDGSSIWANVSVASLPRRSGLPQHEVAVVVDVTARHQAEIALRETNQRLVNIIDSAMDGIVTIDGEQRITVFSRMAEVMFGWRAEQVIGEPIDILVPERHRGAHREYVERYAKSGVSARPMGASLRLTGRRADGTEFPIEAAISRTVEAEQVALTVFVRDVSERERNHEVRQRLERQLEEAKRVEAIGTLASGIAHDFNNILGAILGNAELALQSEDVGSSARGRLEDVMRAGRRGAQLVEQILAFSRDGGEARPAIALGPVVEEVVRLTQVGLPPRVELAVVCEADVPAVLVGEAELHQVVMNLCANALHAIGDEGGSVTVALERVELGGDARETHADLTPGLYALLSVSDTGAGMDAGVRERIFEPFFTTKEVGEGTGLGLSVVHGIVRACGGAVMVHSRPGAGSTFHLYLPAGGEPAEPQAPASPGLGPRAAVAARVLFVDDEGLLVSVGERLLDRLGYRVAAFNDPVDALATLRADPLAFDLVLADFQMPVLSGLDLAREIRRLRPDLPVVLMSGYVTDELQVNAARLGVRHVLSKPTPAREIARVLGMLTGVPTDGVHGGGTTAA